MRLSLKEKANECLSIEALIVFLYISGIPWYWIIVIPTHSNTITLMSGFATTQCWKCHKYPTGFLLIRKQKLSRKQHRMLPDEIKPKNTIWGHETRVGNKYRCTSVWEICQPVENMVRKIINQGGSMMLLLFTARYIFVEFQHSWSKGRVLAWKEFVLAGTVSSHSSYISSLLQLQIVMHTTPPTGRLYKSRHLVNIAA